MSQKVIKLIPVEMEEEIMCLLESKGLITRLIPGAFEKESELNNFEDVVICVSDPASGAHSINSACNNFEYPEAFISHSDHEEVYFIGPEGRKPLYLVFSLLPFDEFNAKAAEDALADSDFVCLRVKFNDHLISCFVINKGALHAEFVEPGCDKKPPSFFFSAGTTLTHYYPDFNGFVFEYVK